MQEKSKTALAHIGSWGFVHLNVTQFLGTLNDHVYKWLLVYLLIYVKGSSTANLVLSLSGAIFVLPFVLLSSLCGKLADNYSKTQIVRLAKVLEIGIMAAGVVAFSYVSELAAYLVLFLMATQSTLFSPAKYGILPELFHKSEVPLANGWLCLFTNIAIIMGSFLAAWITDVTHHDFVTAGFVCVVLAIIGAISSLGVPYSPPSARKKKPLQIRFWKEVIDGLRESAKIPLLRPVIIGNGFFYIIAVYCQLNTLTYAMQEMGMSETAGGYLSPAIAIGIGVGSLVAGKLSHGTACLSFLWKTTFAVTGCLSALYWTHSSILLTVIALFLLGVCASFYIIPTDSFIQLRTPAEHRGEMIGTSNVLSFLGVMVGSGLIWFLGDLLHLSPKEGFIVVGILSGLIGLWLRYRLTIEAKDQIA